MKEHNQVTLTRKIAAAPEHVYRAVASSQGYQEWMADSAEADARPGGRFYAWWQAGFYAAGTFKEAVENQKVVFSWLAPGEPAPTEVEISLTPQEDGTQLTLVHRGLGEGEAWAAAAENFEREWDSSLNNLQAVLETGLDRRLYDRPMLGFFIGGLVDEHLKTRLGLPVDHGMHVAGVIEGMGAARSGLLADDVIAEVDGVPVTDYTSIGSVLGKHKGGDVVPAVVYRGAERIELSVELTKRPAPEFPPPPQEMAGAVREMYRDLLKGLKKSLKGCSDEEAGTRPSEGEWSPKEVMAHLLIAERVSQAAWDLHPEGNKLPEFPGSERLLKAVAESYTVRQLYREIKRSVAVNLAMIASLPESYAANKAAYFLTSGNIDQETRQHFLGHVDQIRAAREAMRSQKS